MENIREFDLDKELISFIQKKRTYKELELSASKMFLLLEYLDINYNQYDEVAFEFMFRYSVYDVRQDGKNVTSLSEIKRRWEDFKGMYFVRLEMFRTIKQMVEIDSSLIDQLKEYFPEEVEMCENGHDMKSAMQEIKRNLLYRTAK